MYSKLEKAVLVQRRRRTAPGVFDGREAFDREVVCYQHGKTTIGNPSQQPLVPPIQHRTAVMSELSIDMAIIAQQQIGKARVQADHIATLDGRTIRFDRPHQPVIADDRAMLPGLTMQIDHDAATLDGLYRHVFDSKRVSAAS
jgi:hypothetical protein